MSALNILSGGAAHGLVKSLAAAFKAKTGLDIEVAGQHDPQDAGKPVVDALQQRGAIHSGHPHVRDDYIDGACLEDAESFLAAAREHHLPLVALRP